MRKYFYLFTMLIVLLSCSSSNKSHQEFLEKQIEKVQKLDDAIGYFNNEEYSKAIFAFLEYHEKYDSTYYDYETNALLSQSYYKTGEYDKGLNVYRLAIDELETYIDTSNKPVRYKKLALEDLKKWRQIYPKFPNELKDIVAKDELPKPIYGIGEYQERIKNDFQGNGRVYLSALINESGDVLNIVVLKSFDERASKNSIEALKETKFTRPKRKGRVAKTWVVIPILFQYD